MSKKKKRKLKIKKKNFIIFILIVILIIFSIAKTTSLIINKISKENKKEIKETLTPKEKKLLELKNINKKLNYFNDKYIDRYINYKNKNKDISLTQVIKDVNMNLDKTHYEYKLPAKNLNTNLVLVNKYNYLEDDYVPEDLEEISKQ